MSIVTSSVTSERVNFAKVSVTEFVESKVGPKELRMMKSRANAGSRLKASAPKKVLKWKGALTE